MKKTELLGMIRTLNDDIKDLRETRNKHEARIKLMEGFLNTYVPKTDELWMKIKSMSTVKTTVTPQDLEPMRELASSVSRRVDELNDRVSVQVGVANQMRIDFGGVAGDYVLANKRLEDLSLRIACLERERASVALRASYIKKPVKKSCRARKVR